MLVKIRRDEALYGDRKEKENCPWCKNSYRTNSLKLRCEIMTGAGWVAEKKGCSMFIKAERKK